MLLEAYIPPGARGDSVGTDAHQETQREGGGLEARENRDMVAVSHILRSLHGSTRGVHQVAAGIAHGRIGTWQVR